MFSSLFFLFPPRREGGKRIYILIQMIPTRKKLIDRLKKKSHSNLFVRFTPPPPSQPPSISTQALIYTSALILRCLRIFLNRKFSIAFLFVENNSNYLVTRNKKFFQQVSVAIFLIIIIIFLILNRFSARKKILKIRFTYVYLIYTLILRPSFVLSYFSVILKKLSYVVLSLSRSGAQFHARNTNKRYINIESFCFSSNIFFFLLLI